MSRSVPAISGSVATLHMCRRGEMGDSPLEGDSYVTHKAFSFLRKKCLAGGGGEKQIGSQVALLQGGFSLFRKSFP